MEKKDYEKKLDELYKKAVEDGDTRLALEILDRSIPPLPRGNNNNRAI